MPLICQICGCDLEAVGVLACGTCGTPFHRDCWEFNGGCAVYGCGGSTTTAWEERTPGDGVLRIDEGTEPAFRLAPYVESLVRSLPGWARSVGPTVFVGLAVALLAMTVGMVLTGEEVPWDKFWRITGMCVLGSLTVTGLAEPTRRHPTTVVLGGSFGLAVGFHLVWMAHTEFWGSAVIVGMGLSALAAANALAELAVGRWRRLRGAGSMVRAAVRGAATYLGFALVSVVFGLTIELWMSRADLARFSATSVWEALPIILFCSLLGLVAVAPSLVLACSPLMYRLKKEAEREGSGP